MGFWHTGYMEFHEPTGLDLPVPRPPVHFVCDLCGGSFPSASARDDHRFEAHPKHKPVLIVHGRELGADRLRITRTLGPSDVLVDCDLAWLNDAKILPCDLPVALARRPASDVCRIRLRKDSIDTTFELEFRIASRDDLDCVESRFEEISRQGRLDSQVVEEFIRMTSECGTAIGYCDGICGYLYGILAREQRPGSTLTRSDYERKFNNAAENLAGYDRPLARTIGSLIEFHFNHFRESAALAPDSRVGATWEKYAQWIYANRNVRPNAGEEYRAAPGARASTGECLDGLLTDAVTERIVRWSIGPLSELFGAAEDIEAHLTNDLPPYDQAKLHVLLGELHAAYGKVDCALRHARAVRNMSPFKAWADQLVVSIRR